MPSTSGGRRGNLGIVGYGGPQMMSTPASYEVDGLMDKLLVEDESHGFFKDLISAAGLRTAWTDLLRRMKSLERTCVELWNTASTEALERDYVTRPEYMRVVEQAHSSELTAHNGRLATLDDAAALSKEKAEAHDSRLDDLESASRQHTAREDSFEMELEKAVDRSDAHHEEVLQLMRDRDRQLDFREVAHQELLRGLDARLDGNDRHRQQLEDRIQDIRTFLGSEHLTHLIKDVCTEILAHYVCKEEMLREVQVSADFVVKPVREGLEELTREVGHRVTELRDTDRALQTTLTQAIENHGSLERMCDTNFQAIFKDVGTRATQVDMESLDARMREDVKTVEASLEALRSDAGRKMQEVVERVSEFQVILEDHEHALEHQAEEMLNRATKYDLVVCQQRVDKCAIKEKVDNDLKDLQSTVAWQTDQLEVLGYGKSFAPPRSDSALSLTQSQMLTPSTTKQPAHDESVALTDSTTLPSTTLPSTTFPEGSRDLMCQHLPPEAPPLPSMPEAPRPTSTSVTSSRPGSRAFAAVAMAAAMASTGAMQEAPENIRFQTPGQAMGLMPGTTPKAMAPANTEVYSLIRMQMESLVQGILGVALLTSRMQGPALSREARQDKESEMIHHLHCLLQWIMYGRAPMSWEPNKLATFALRSLERLAGHDADPFADDVSPERNPAHVPHRAAIRRNRRPGGPEASAQHIYTSDSMARAREVASADRAAYVPQTFPTVPLGGGFGAGGRVARGFAARSGAAGPAAGAASPGVGSRPGTVPGTPGQGLSALGSAAAGGVGSLSARQAQPPRSAPSGDTLLASAAAVVQRGGPNGRRARVTPTPLESNTPRDSRVPHPLSDDRLPQLVAKDSAM